MENKPGVRTSEFKMAVATAAATFVLGVMKAAGVALMAGVQWWAVPLGMAITSLGYSLSRGLAKRGALPAPAGSDTQGIPLKTPES